MRPATAGLIAFKGSSASASKSPGAAAMHQSGSVGVRSARPPASVTSSAPGTQSQR